MPGQGKKRAAEGVAGPAASKKARTDDVGAEFEEIQDDLTNLDPEILADIDTAVGQEAEEEEAEEDERPDEQFSALNRGYNSEAILDEFANHISGNLSAAFRRFRASMKRRIEEEARENANNSIESDTSEEGPRTDWPSTDPLVDEMWNGTSGFVENVSELAVGSDFRASELVKPSGSLKSLGRIEWHYATYATARKDYGVTADRTNPCLRTAFNKLKLTTGSEIFQHEQFFGRWDYDAKVKNKPQLSLDEDETRCHQAFNDALWQRSEAKVVMILGEHNVKALESRRIPGLRTEKVIVSGLSMFQTGPAHVWLVLSKDQEIERILVPAYHTQYHLISGDRPRCDLMDFLWNVFAALTGLQPNGDYYLWKTTSNVRRENFLSSFIHLRGEEKRTGAIIPASEMPECLRMYIERENISADPGQSILQEIGAHFRAKRLAAWKAKTDEEKAVIRAKRQATWAAMSDEKREAIRALHSAAWAAKTDEEKAIIRAKLSAAFLANWDAKPDEEKAALRAELSETKLKRTSEQVADFVAKRAATMAAKTAEQKAAIETQKLAGRAAWSDAERKAYKLKEVATKAAKTDAEKAATKATIAKTKAEKTPEQKAAIKAKTLATMAARTPEEKAMINAKRAATRAANLKAKQQKAE